jgi:lysophospholipase L1-like esterase
MNLVFLGDSLTNGSYGGDWVALVREALPDHTIINAGVGGDTVVNLLARLEAILEQHTPDAIFVMVGGNDAVSYTMPDTRGYYRSAKKIADGVVTPELFRTTYRELLTTLLLRHVQPLVGLAPTEYNQTLIEAKRQFNQIAREEAEALNVPVCDLETGFTPAQPVERGPVTLAFIQEIGQRQASGWREFAAARDAWGYTYTFDGMHLMPEAAPLLAERVITFLKDQLVL